MIEIWEMVHLKFENSEENRKLKITDLENLTIWILQISKMINLSI